MAEFRTAKAGPAPDTFRAILECGMEQFAPELIAQFPGREGYLPDYMAEALPP